MAQDFLIEIGTEELPDRELQVLSEALEQQFIIQLKSLSLSFSKTRCFSTPRRLALLVTQLSEKQPEQSYQRKGPSLQIAFQDKKPTTALHKFAQSCGVTWEALTELNSSKGSWMVYDAIDPGQPTHQLLPQIIQKTISALPLSRKMKWGAHQHEFLRPVHWIVILFGKQTIACDLWGISSNNTTRGHRTHHDHSIPLSEPQQYETLLMQKGHVIPHFETRKNQILDLLPDILQPGMQPILTPDLLQVVTGLTEWPIPLLGRFEPEFLSMPQAVLISTIEEHQKCFTIKDEKDQLLPYFIMIANLKSRDPSQVIAGNEKVIRSRLSDAQFFYEQDQRTSLTMKREALRQIIFQSKLGSLYEKTERIATWMQTAWHEPACLDLNQYPLEEVLIASQLTKSDLITQLVLEFPKLQGIAGRQYGLLEGLPPTVCQTLEEHYWPRFSGDQLPNIKLSAYVSLADKWDTLVGLFGIQKIPSGTKDPFALRRTALGVLRIMIHHQTPITLSQCASFALNTYTAQSIKIAPNTLDSVIAFILERFAYWLQQQGTAIEIFRAVTYALNDYNPYDILLKIKALELFQTTTGAHELIQAHKRIKNLLQSHTEPLKPVQAKRLVQAEELTLFKQLQAQDQALKPVLAAQDYTKALSILITLNESIIQFFDQVLVNSQDSNERLNRYALLNQLDETLSCVGCLSQLISS